MIQRERIKRTLLPSRADKRLDGEGPHFTLGELSEITGISESCVSAQLRHLRRYGCIVTKRKRECGLNFIVWEYSLRPAPVDKLQEQRERENARRRTPEYRAQNNLRKRNRYAALKAQVAQ